MAKKNKESKTQKKQYKQSAGTVILKILLYLLGFPLMAALVALNSMHVIESGLSYGFWVFGGVAIVVLVTLIYFVVAGITGHISKKAKTVKGLRGATAALVVVSVFLTTGLWMIIDKVMPPILEDATDGTITYEQIKENYNAQADVHKNLLDHFIKLNVANGNLPSKDSKVNPGELTLEDYLAQGYANPEVKELLHSNFKSLDAGYKSFKGPWLPLGNDNRLTVPVIVSLILAERETTDLPYTLVLERKPIPVLTDKTEGTYDDGTVRGDSQETVQWSIMDMQQGTMVLDLGGMLPDMPKPLMQIISGLVATYAPDILTALNDAIADPALAGSPIYIGLDMRNDGLAVNITPTSDSRGVWDYMHMAWLNSNNLLFMVVSLFPDRNIFLYFGGIVAVLSLAIGVLREKRFKKDEPVEQPTMPAGGPKPYPENDNLVFENRYSQMMYQAAKRKQYEQQQRYW